MYPNLQFAFLNLQFAIVRRGGAFYAAPLLAPSPAKANAP